VCRRCDGPNSWTSDPDGGSRRLAQPWSHAAGDDTINRPSLLLAPVSTE
jgi:hypothetical protein